MTGQPEPDHRDRDRDWNDAPGRGWLARRLSNFQLTIISLFGTCAMAGILPFAVFRFLEGDLFTAVGDAVLVLVIGAMVVYAWITGRTGLAGAATAVVVTIGYLLLVSFGSISLLWAYPVLAASYLLTTRHLATVACLAMLVTLSLQPALFESTVHLWSFVVTGSLVALFGLIFATRTAIQHSQLVETAVRDPLTGAGNRRALRIRFDAIEQHGGDRNSPSSLILMDIDRFKPINDRHGHEAGDEVLVDLVQIVHEATREGDAIYRLGGEEFIVLLPDTDLPGARAVVAKIRDVLHARLRGPDGPVTVSMGVATRREGESAREWLLRADKAMYEAKRQGRDRIVFAQP